MLCETVTYDRIEEVQRGDESREGNLGADVAVQTTHTQQHGKHTDVNPCTCKRCRGIKWHAHMRHQSITYRHMSVVHQHVHSHIAIPSPSGVSHVILICTALEKSPAHDVATDVAWDAVSPVEMSQERHASRHKAHTHRER